MEQTLSDMAIPILPSQSIKATAQFYRQLGFEGGAHPFDPVYAILRLGTVELHFFKHPGLVPAESSAGCYLRVQDVNRLHRAFAEAALPGQGIPRLEAPP
ncbi:MAG: VOC family protein [Vitreoscilla sp.]|nr:VOC family protein [Vitreoscilla sp.]